MKKLKVYWMGQRLKDVYPHATRWEVLKWRVREFLKKILRMVTYAGLLYGSFTLGAYLNPVTTYATREKIVEVRPIPPVMQRIAKCESSTGHYDKNGKVAKNKNKDGSVDIGKYQINVNVWGVIAMEKDLNLTDEKDNEEFAMWLYETYGTEPWVFSKHCWR